ncbi:hypothetical protein Q2K19_28315 [Micromonospora soli]|uniref:hypothetical protein n=1 Tax=Micromonospora sp. NBRC 110009 TaxID=3061627 RepID=UPI002673518C|nr:hypothetical protein [Micromonospora sp. NBRC 110009]WKT98031.1 hypothetical protein Q2K19_28315 [Micromonospora sp. NBRC 110009]
MQPSPTAPAPPRRAGSRAVTAGLALLFGAVAAVAGAAVARHATVAVAGQPATTTFVVSGAVLLDAQATFRTDGRGGCAGTDDLVDIRDGTPVVIAAGAGQLPVGQLTDGRVLTDGTCRFWFAVRGVPAGHAPYRILVGSRGGDTAYTEADLTGALVTLHLGG